MNASTQPARLRPFRPQPFGRYTLLSHLATGGMGEIYLARLEGAQGFEKLCVIKKILPQLAADSDFVERFVGEARTLVRLSHGSIAQVLDMGLHDGEAYMALEYVDGKDLRKVAARVRDRQSPLPLTFILYTMGRVLDALAYAHRKKDDDGEELRLVHRDISPQNILISYEGEVKVIDFGLAKSRLSAAKTNPSIILGKFLYMSPEQARHQPVDRRSDLYAVGLCLYELICGKNPFDSVHPGELMTVVAQPKIAPLDEVEPLTPRVVTALVSKALAVEPSQRFQTAEEFRGRLQSCLMEIDANAGPESVSRFMRELFAADFQSERRLLATLKEVPRVPAGEFSPEEGGQAPRPMMPAMLPPKTIRLDGPVQPLSFHPTPRSREGGGPVSDGETRPGVMVDESTRPAFPLEALEEEARARAARQQSAGESASSVEVRPEAFDRQVPVEPPPAPRPPSLTREVPMAVLPPEAIPPAPEPRPTPADLRPTELALPSVQPRQAPEMPWDDAAEPPAATAESTDPRAQPLAPPAPSESQALRAAWMPPPPPPPSRTGMPAVASAIPAVGAPPPGSPAPRPPAPPAPASTSPRPGAPPPAPVPPPAPASAGPRAGAQAPAPVPPPAVAPAPASASPRAGAQAPAPMPPPAVVPPRPAMGAAPPPPVAPTAPAPSESQALRAAGIPPPPRTGAVMMPAIAVAAPVPPPQRTASLTAMPVVAPPPGSTPSRGTPPVTPSAELDVVPGVAESEEDASWGASPDSGAEGGGDLELPVLTPEEMGHAEDGARPGEVDTHPRIARPSRTERTEDTQPRVARDGDTDPRVQQRHDATQPRVVLDEALLRDVEGTSNEPEEKSGPNRPRAAPRRPRTASAVGIPVQGGVRRTGPVAAVRPAPAPAPVRVDDDDEDDDVRVSLTPHEETRRTPIPVRPGSEPGARRPGEDTRRTAIPARGASRKGTGLMAVGLVVLLLAGAILTLALSPALRISMGLEQGIPDGPPLPKPMGPTRKSSPSSGASQTGGDSQSTRTAAPTADTAPTDTAPSAAAPTGAAPAEAAPAEAVEPAQVAAVPEEAAPKAAEVPAPVAEAAVPAPESARPPEAIAIDDSDLLAPLPAPEAPAPKPAQVKRAPAAKKVRVVPRGKEATQLQREWREANALYKKLKSQYSCIQLGIWCNHLYEDIRNEVEAAGDDNDPDTLRKVKDMKRQLLTKQRELE